VIYDAVDSRPVLRDELIESRHIARLDVPNDYNVRIRFLLAVGRRNERLR